MTGAALATFGGATATPGMSIAFSAPFVSGTYRGSSSTPQNILTSAVTATVSGGVGPFTYAWAILPGAPYTWTISAPTAATTSFTANGVEAGGSTDADFQLTVTDSLGTTAKATITADAFNESTA